ncbi:MAG: thioesterase family protein [Alcanivorax sp.]|nr:thioesterase family protein [Alcanivorax sp.]
MFELTLSPRFYETDAFGHVNNTVMTGWFETGREPLFRIFQGQRQDPGELPLILARVEVDFVAQTYYGQPVTLRTAIERLGNASFVVAQQAWQNGNLVARGKAVQVHFDHATQASSPLPASLREALEAHLEPLPETF